MCQRSSLRGMRVVNPTRIVVKCSKNSMDGVFSCRSWYSFAYSIAIRAGQPVVAVTETQHLVVGPSCLACLHRLEQHLESHRNV